jgi:hypothetical protein
VWNWCKRNRFVTSQVSLNGIAVNGGLKQRLRDRLLLLSGVRWALLAGPIGGYVVELQG